MENELQKRRIAAYRSASPVVQDQYGSMELGEILKSISLSQSLSPEKHRDFVNLIGDFILGFYPENSMAEKLVSEIGFTSDTVKGTVSAVTGFLTGIKTTPTVPEAPKDLKEKLELRPEETPPQTPDGGVRPLTREEVLRSLAPARTMAGDIASIQKQTPVPTPSVPPTSTV
jgi:hypothetical protein